MSNKADEGKGERGNAGSAVPENRLTVPSDAGSSNEKKVGHDPKDQDAQSTGHADPSSTEAVTPLTNPANEPSEADLIKEKEIAPPAASKDEATDPSSDVTVNIASEKQGESQTRGTSEGRGEESREEIVCRLEDEEAIGQEISAKEEPDELVTNTSLAAQEKEPPIEANDDGKNLAVATASTFDDGEKRNIVLGDGSEGRLTTYLIEDLLRFQQVLWILSGKPIPQSEADTDLVAAVERVIKILKGGKFSELAGLKDVPRPFLRTRGRILTKIASGYEDLSDEDSKRILSAKLFESFTGDDLTGVVTESPYKEFKDIMDRNVLQGNANSKSAVPTTPLPKDVLLFPCSDAFDDKLYEQQLGNKVIFNLAAQLVTSFANNSYKRVEAALMIVKGLLDSEMPSADEKHSDSNKPRFLLRRSTSARNVVMATADSGTWTALTAEQAAEFALAFVFEVFLEKELHLVSEAPAQTESHSKNPISEPTENDVLFGRGGMTNSHPGNRRFRDIIALHRPDYIRAVKMDKPAVARKIVRAIRMGHPKGSFLKKGEDGLWCDVGDKTAAEKTSQGLRERTNAEKRQRSALREALRIRKEDLEDSDEQGDATAGITVTGAETPVAKKAKVSVDSGTAATSTDAVVASSLNYVGASLTVPLSLSMAQIVAANSNKKNEAGNTKARPGSTELHTEGLPPNAVDEEGNILVTDYDILCGRGGLTNHHKGNKRFRDIVALHRPDYVRAPKIQKPSVARVIVRAIRNGDPPGRFLRKDEKTGKWIDVGDKKAAEKTSQALREKSNDERENEREEAVNPLGGLIPNSSTLLAAATANVMGSMLSEASALSIDAVALEAAVATASAVEVEKASDDNDELRKSANEDVTRESSGEKVSHLIDEQDSSANNQSQPLPSVAVDDKVEDCFDVTAV